MSRVGKAYKQSGTVRAWRTAFKAGVRAPKVQRMSAVAQEGLASILQRAVDALEARSERGTALSPPKELLVRVAPSFLWGRTFSTERETPRRRNAGDSPLQKNVLNALRRPTRPRRTVTPSTATP